MIHFRVPQGISPLLTPELSVGLLDHERPSLPVAGSTFIKICRSVHRGGRGSSDREMNCFLHGSDILCACKIHKNLYNDFSAV